MKKTRIVLSVIAALSTAASAEIMNWTSYDDLGANLLAATGTGAQAGWIAQLYAVDTARDNTTMVNGTAWYNNFKYDKSGSDNDAGMTAVDGITHTVTDDGGWLEFASTPTTAASGNYVTVLFNSADKATATYTVVMDSSTFFLKNGDGLNGIAPQYAAFKNYETDLAWQPVVPEPATLGMMGAAGVALFLSRRKTRR